MSATAQGLSCEFLPTIIIRIEAHQLDQAVSFVVSEVIGQRQSCGCHSPIEWCAPRAGCIGRHADFNDGRHNGDAMTGRPCRIEQRGTCGALPQTLYVWRGADAELQSVCGIARLWLGFSPLRSARSHLPSRRTGSPACSKLLVKIPGMPRRTAATSPAAARTERRTVPPMAAQSKRHKCHWMRGAGTSRSASCCSAAATSRRACCR